MPDPFDELVRRAVTGEAEAYRALLEETRRWAERFIGHRIQPPERREEVLQDVLLSVHRSFATYDPRYPFRAWLKAVVTSRVRDALRVQYATVERLTDEGELPDQAAPDAAPADAVHELLESALQGLNEIQRRIFTALKLEGRTVRETAAELGMSEGATKVAAHRAYRKIRTELTKEDAE